MRDIIVARKRGGLCNNLKCYLSSMRIGDLNGLDVATDCADLVQIYSNLSHVSDFSERIVAKNYCDWRLAVFEQDALPKGFAKSSESMGFEGANKDRLNIDFEYHHIPASIQKIYLDYLKKMDIRINLERYARNFSIQNFTADTVSVHLRTWLTDDWDQAPKRHQHFFNEEKYRKIIEKHLDNGIFLSSDNNRYAERIKAEYGDSIITVERDGLKDPVEFAFINLLLLSRNSIIYGSKISTYTEMAWWYSGCTAEVILI